MFSRPSSCEPWDHRLQIEKAAIRLNCSRDGAAQGSGIPLEEAESGVFPKPWGPECPQRHRGSAKGATLWLEKWFTVCPHQLALRGSAHDRVPASNPHDSLGRWVWRPLDGGVASGCQSLDSNPVSLIPERAHSPLLAAGKRFSGVCAQSRRGRGLRGPFPNSTHGPASFQPAFPVRCGPPRRRGRPLALGVWFISQQVRGVWVWSRSAPARSHGSLDASQPCRRQPPGVQLGRVGRGKVTVTH